MRFDILMVTSHDPAREGGQMRVKIYTMRGDFEDCLELEGDTPEDIREKCADFIKGADDYWSVVVSE